MDKKVNRPIYLHITVDGVLKEMSIKRSWDPARWNSKIGRAIVSKLTAGRRSASTQTLPPTPDDEAQALNAYLDTLQAKVHEARHQLLTGAKSTTAEAVGNIVKGKESSGERQHLLLEIFQYHNDQVKTLIGKEYSKGTLTKFNTVLKHTRSFLQWKYKLDDIDIQKLDYEFQACPGSRYLSFQLLYWTGLCRPAKAEAIGNKYRHRRREMDLYPAAKDRYSLPNTLSFSSRRT